MASSSTPFTAQDIAKGNDHLRQNLDSYFRKPDKGNMVVITRGVERSKQITAVLKAVKYFDEFTADNDPYGEHDFAFFMVQGEKFFFKIDYYNRECTMGVDPYQEIPFRVLTIGLADEY